MIGKMADNVGEQNKPGCKPHLTDADPAKRMGQR
jgi:hypothetical protein